MIIKHILIKYHYNIFNKLNIINHTGMKSPYERIITGGIIYS